MFPFGAQNHWTDEQIDRNYPARRSPRRPAGVERRHWFGMPREYRREHFWCCVVSWMYCRDCGRLDPDITCVCAQTVGVS